MQPEAALMHSKGGMKMNEASHGSLGTAECLLLMAQRRDGAAWEALVERHGMAIYSIALRILRDESLADDAVQETLLQVRDHAGQFQTPSAKNADRAAQHWIMQIAANTALQFLRRKQTSARAAKQRPLPQRTDVDPAAQLAGSEALQRALLQLSDEMRQAIVLRFYADLDYSELAAALKCPEGTVKARVSRGLKDLRERLALLGLLLPVADMERVMREATAPPKSPAHTPQTGRWKELLNGPQSPALAFSFSKGGSLMQKIGMGFSTIAAAGVLIFALTHGLADDTEPAASENASDKPETQPSTVDTQGSRQGTIADKDITIIVGKDSMTGRLVLPATNADFRLKLKDNGQVVTVAWASLDDKQRAKVTEALHPIPNGANRSKEEPSIPAVQKAEPAAPLVSVSEALKKIADGQAPIDDFFIGGNIESLRNKPDLKLEMGMVVRTGNILVIKGHEAKISYSYVSGFRELTGQKVKVPTFEQASKHLQLPEEDVVKAARLASACADLFMTMDEVRRSEEQQNHRNNGKSYVDIVIQRHTASIGIKNDGDDKVAELLTFLKELADRVYEKGQPGR
jgi:RNA polymerase sigma-70 factor (ECF subfamily)